MLSLQPNCIWLSISVGEEYVIRVAAFTMKIRSLYYSPAVLSCLVLCCCAATGHGRGAIETRPLV